MPRNTKVLGGSSGRSMTTAPSSSRHHHHYHSNSINHNNNNSSSNHNNNNTSRRIVIKPFQKPPTLPVDFYETTSERLLQGTLLAARLGDDNDTKQQQQLDQHQQQQQQQQQQQRRLASPQTWYSSVVDLVAHQLGPRLYRDLQMTMALATRRVLPDDHPFTTAAAATTTSTSSSMMLLDVSSAIHPSLLHYVQTQYQRYLDYVVLCQHVFLPLDQTHIWIPPNHVVKRTSSTATTTTTSTAGVQQQQQQQQQQQASSGGAGAWSGSSSSTSWSGKTVTTNSPTTVTTTAPASSGPPQCLWQVALEQFRCRLETLQLDSVIYQAWWQALRQDWLEGTGLPGGSHNSNTSLLQSTLFMWQDLQVLPHMLQSLQADLEVFFTQLALQHQQQQQLSYRPDRFIYYVYQKWMHVSYQWTFLPRNWLRTLIEVHLLQPHLTTEWLLHPVHVTMLLEEDELNLTDTTTGILNNPTEDQSSSLMSRSASSASPPPAHWVQLWMLAARLPEGHKVMTTALCNYTKTKGLAIVNNAFTAPAAAKTMIGNLLVLQRRMVRWQQRLLQVSTSSSGGTTNQGTGTIITSSPSSLDALKHVWEDIINLAHPNNSQIVAECLAKYMDPLLRSTKMELESSNSSSTTTTTTMTSTTSNNTAAAIAAAANNDHPTIYQIQQQVLQLFVYLQAKDVFEAFYKKDLAKRLLWNRVVSMDVERHFVTLLKTECGAGYTSKMEGMFADVELSRETMNRYKQQQQAPPPPVVAGAASPSVEMEVQVLTTGYWPVYPQLPHLILPESLTAPQEQFANYYRDKYQGRRITWQYALGHVLVRGHYAAIPVSAKAMAAAAASSSTSSTSTTGARQYEFVVSLCQALVLLQFNPSSSSSSMKNAASKRWTLPQLQRAIGVEDRDEMERILQSLSLGKDGTRVLRKLDHDAGMPVVAPAAVASVAFAEAGAALPLLPPPPPSPMVAASPATGRAKKVRMNVDDQDVFVVDERFRSQQRRIRINNILWKETMEEREKTVESVSRDRLYLIDAVLVRILKARKTITHPQLMQQVMEQVKVPAQASDIKKRIESLIEREYMERDGEDRNRYNYLA